MFLWAEGSPENNARPERPQNGVPVKGRTRGTKNWTRCKRFYMTPSLKARCRNNADGEERISNWQMLRRRMNRCRFSRTRQRHAACGGDSLSFSLLIASQSSGRAGGRGGSFIFQRCLLPACPTGGVRPDTSAYYSRAALEPMPYSPAGRLQHRCRFKPACVQSLILLALHWVPPVHALDAVSLCCSCVQFLHPSASSFRLSFHWT